MKEQYENILDFTKVNVPFEDWNISLNSSLSGEKNIGFHEGLKMDQSIKSIGKRRVNIGFKFYENYIIERGIDASIDEIVSSIWNKIFSTLAFNNFLSSKGLRPDTKLQIRHFVPIEKDESTSYVIILFHKDYTKEEPLKLTLSTKLKNDIINELYPKKPSKIEMHHFVKELDKLNKLSLLNFAIGLDVFKQVISSNVFQIVIFRHPEIDYLASTPIQGAGVGIDLHKSTSSMGVIARDMNGIIGCTTCYHDFAKVKDFKIGNLLFINGHQAKINSIDILSDSCFAAFLDSNDIPTSTPNNGPLFDVSPRAGQVCDFVGIASGHAKTIVTSWDPSIPHIKPQSGLINMNKIYSTPSVNPGDSGSALIDTQNHILGFAAYRTGVGFPIPFAAWIWAENVFFAHSIS